MRFGTDRKTPARPVKGGGFAPKVLQSVDQWTKQFDVPLLSLTPIDTIRQLALDPTQLTTIREAQALLARTDSIRKALDQGFQQLNIRRDGGLGPWPGSAASSATDPKKLGLDGTRQAIESVQADPPADRRGQETAGGAGAEHPHRRCSSSVRARSCWIRPGRRISPLPSPCSSCPASRRPTSAARSSAR